MKPLTHHEILELIQPFTRRGCRADLAASDRLARRIAFKAVEHAGASDAPGLSATLLLEDLGTGSYRLTRRLAPAFGPTASVEAVGPQPGDLLERIAQVPLRRQFAAAGGGVALNFALPPGSDPAPVSGPALIFSGGEAWVAGLILKLDAAPGRGDSALLTLTRAAGDTLHLPQDALAVLGSQWSRLRESGDGWTAGLRLRRREPWRSRHAEAALAAAVPHLERMLGEPPGRFHERWIASRWRVFSRRLVPLAACVGLIGCAAAVPKLHLAANSGLRMLILNSPPLLLILCFCLREIPIVEIPPLPRRCTRASWRDEDSCPAIR